MALCLAAIDGKLDSTHADWDPRPAVGVVLAAGGYPSAYNKGDVISGIPDGNSTGKVFHAGTQLENGNLVTNGGRVLCATAMGDTVSAAQQLAYSIAKQIKWKDAFYRTDIAYRAIARE